MHYRLVCMNNSALLFIIKEEKNLGGVLEHLLLLYNFHVRLLFCFLKYLMKYLEQIALHLKNYIFS